jgi:hypothetical protein
MSSVFAVVSGLVAAALPTYVFTPAAVFSTTATEWNQQACVPAFLSTEQQQHEVQPADHSAPQRPGEEHHAADVARPGDLHSVGRTSH